MFETNIYPNPSNGIFVLESNFTGEWKVLNQLGQEVKRFSTKFGNNDINISELEKGVYWIVSLNSKVETYKLILSR